MNTIILKGFIRNIQPSHKIKDIEYDKADLIVRRNDGKEDVLNLRFKKFSNVYKEDQEIELVGNIRSYSHAVEGGKNKVDIYVFTYFDIPDEEEVGNNPNNYFTVSGRICKIDEIRTTQNGKQNIHFLLANNLVFESSNQKLNSYLPCIAWGKIAKEIAKYSVNGRVTIKGELHSRNYKKQISEDEFELRVAHELLVTSITKDEEEPKENAV